MVFDRFTSCLGPSLVFFRRFMGAWTSTNFQRPKTFRGKKDFVKYYIYVTGSNSYKPNGLVVRVARERRISLVRVLLSFSQNFVSCLLCSPLFEPQDMYIKKNEVFVNWRQFTLHVKMKKRLKKILI